MCEYVVLGSGLRDGRPHCRYVGETPISLARKYARRACVSRQGKKDTKRLDQILPFLQILWHVKGAL